MRGLRLLDPLDGPWGLNKRHIFLRKYEIVLVRKLLQMGTNTASPELFFRCLDSAYFVGTMYLVHTPRQLNSLFCLIWTWSITWSPLTTWSASTTWSPPTTWSPSTTWPAPTLQFSQEFDDPPSLPLSLVRIASCCAYGRSTVPIMPS